jgi:tyrosyl-tRNA synthetase
LRELYERGFIHNITDIRLMKPEFSDQKLVPYVGFDLTAPSLHVGSLIQLRVLKKFIEHDIAPVILLGEATTRIGDPTGKDKSRPMLDDITIRNNFNGILRAVTRVLGPSGAIPLHDALAGQRPEKINFRVVSNADWFSRGGPSFIDFMQEFGPHFTINRINTLDVVRRRLEENIPMTFLEYVYVLLQSVDFLRLHERYGVDLQIGGSDQWGNIINGADLVRRVLGETVYGVTTTLLTTSAGEKMGKTAGGAVWLDPDLTSPYDFFQFWRNIPDDRVNDFSLLFTDIPKEQIEHKCRTDINGAKEALALTVTADVHGDDAAREALDEARRVFHEGQPAREIQIGENMTVVDAIHALALAPSRGAARRLLGGNAVSVNGDKVHEDQPVSVGDVIRVGKKHSLKIV